MGNFIQVVSPRLQLNQKTADSCVGVNEKNEEQLSAQQTIITLNKNMLFTHQTKITKSSLEHLKKFGVSDGDIRKQLKLLDERLSVVVTEIQAMRGSREPPRFSPSGSRGMDQLDYHLKLHNKQIEDQEQATSCFECTSYDGAFVLKIDEVQCRFRDAATGKCKWVQSPPFYTSHRGYKCQLSVYLNGDGVCRGTRVRIYRDLARRS